MPIPFLAILRLFYFQIAEIRLFKMHGTSVLLIFWTLCSVVLASPARRAIGDCFSLLNDEEKALFKGGSLPCTAVPAGTVTHGDFKVSTYHWEKVNGNVDIQDTFGPQEQLHLNNIVSFSFL